MNRLVEVISEYYNYTGGVEYRPAARRMCSDFARARPWQRSSWALTREYTLEEGLKRTLDWYAEKNSHGQ